MLIFERRRLQLTFDSSSFSCDSELCLILQDNSSRRFTISGPRVSRTLPAGTVLPVHFQQGKKATDQRLRVHSTPYRARFTRSTNLPCILDWSRQTLLRSDRFYRNEGADRSDPHPHSLQETVNVKQPTALFGWRLHSGSGAQARPCFLAACRSDCFLPRECSRGNKGRRNV